MTTESIALRQTTAGEQCAGARWISPRYAMKTDAVRGVLLIAALVLLELTRRLA